MAERIALRVEEGGQRVDRFLAAHSLLSRSAIARLAKDGRVLVDGTAVEPAYKVRLGQELVVDVPDAAPALSLAAENIPIAVIYEDDDVIVVNKPAGLVVHPAYGHATGTLVNAVVGKITADTGRAASRPGIVHRLDKDTSGVLVVAKNDAAHLSLSRQIQAQKFGKEYLALVWGDPGTTPAIVEAPLLRDPTGFRPPGFLEIDLVGEAVSVIHHAWTGAEWSIFPLIENLPFFPVVSPPPLLGPTASSNPSSPAES